MFNAWKLPTISAEEPAEFSINQKETEERLVHTIHGMVLNNLQQTNAPPEEYASMIAYGEEVNKQYFSGNLTDSTELLNCREYQLWEGYGKDTFFWQYLIAILTEFKPS